MTIVGRWVNGGERIKGRNTTYPNRLTRYST